MAVELGDIVARLANRSGSTEADIQSDVRAVLLYGGLDLDTDDLNEITLEAQAGGGKRIDVEIGASVIEVKKKAVLDNETRHAEAVVQLASYMASRTQQTGQRYVGVLTDGVRWELYRLLEGGDASFVARFDLDPRSPDHHGLAVWLEGVLATRQGIVPTPGEIEARLGHTSPSFRLDVADLQALYKACRDTPEVKLKRELWARLLRDALGTAFTDDDELWVRHTYLVITAEIIAHAVVGTDLTDPRLTGLALLSGEQFATAKIGGVVEPDFFDWPIDVAGGARFVMTEARRLARFDWSKVEHDVLKALYESVIDAETRHSLGEYYTPDWLAEKMVNEVAKEPLNQKVLDPACGSGTFLFWAVRRYLEAADRAGVSNLDAIDGVVSHVSGIDLHPVAVTLARVTYLLAIGLDRLRDRNPFNVPVYLGDSVQWKADETLLGTRGLVVYTTDGVELFAQELVFPDRVIDDPLNFDQLVTELTDRAASRARGSQVPQIGPILSRHKVHPDDRPELERTFEVLCRLHDEHRNHIWGYYVRNRARPAWFARNDNRVDVVVGNPPWLAYRYMPDEMQRRFVKDSKDRNLWTGHQVSTHQDLSALFVARSVELYLKTGGTFGFVMPAAVLSRQQYQGFREGNWSHKYAGVFGRFDTSWNLTGIKPTIFPVPSAVVLGTRGADHARPMPESHINITGKLKNHQGTWTKVSAMLTESAGTSAAKALAGEDSPYAVLFTQGANLVPRVLLVVEPRDPGPLGVPAGRVAIQSRRTTLEKPPWKLLPAIEGNVEASFVRRAVFGVSVAPFRVFDSELAVIPRDGKGLIGVNDSRLDDYPGLADWWRRAEQVWRDNRSDSTTASLLEWIDWRAKLESQFPVPPLRVVYTKAGANLCAALVNDAQTVIDHKLYWAPVGSVEEADYLCAIFNSQALLKRVRPLQAVGQFGPRDFDTYVFKTQFPLYRSDDADHHAVAMAGQVARETVASLDLSGVNYRQARPRVAVMLECAGAAEAIEGAVDRLLASVDASA